MLRFHTFALLALLPLCAAAEPPDAAAEPPDAAAVAGWIRDLGADDAATRGAAEKQLLENPAAALPAVRAEIARGDAGDAERQARLKRIVETIEHAEQWEALFVKSPVELANDYVKDRRCGLCKRDRIPWKVVPIRHEALDRRFPDARFFALDWDCCEDKPIATVVLAVTRKADVRIEVGTSDDWVERLAPHLAPVRTEEEAAEAASLLVCLNTPPREFGAAFEMDASLGSAREENGAFVVDVMRASGRGTPAWTVRFDEAGRLAGIRLAGR